MDEADYSIYLSHTNAMERMDKFNDRAVKAKTYKTMHKNFRNADAVYAEYRELIEQQPDYATLTLDHLAGILNDD